VGLIGKLLFFPVAAPVAGIRWTLNQVQKVAEEELTDDTDIRRDLMELQLRLELGEIDDAGYAVAEADIMARLRAVREWRERLGKSVSGGPVKVSDG
jgi:Gas vesicle protein G